MPIIDEGDNSTSDKISEVIQEGAVAFNIFSLIKLVGGGLLFIIIFLFLASSRIPWYITGIVIAFIVLMVILQIIRLKRISSVKL